MRRLADRPLPRDRVAVPDARARRSSTLGPGDVALGRLDVLPTVDGVDDGLWSLGELAAAGVRVLNGPSALLAAHDKLLTARLLHGAGLPHPRTRLAVASAPAAALRRAGRRQAALRQLGPRRRPLRRRGHAARAPARARARSRGTAGTARSCRSSSSRRATTCACSSPAGAVVGAIKRVAAPGEWRTNIALGAHREPAVPPPDAVRARARGRGGRRTPTSSASTCCRRGDGWTVIELNGAVDFTSDYSLEPRRLRRDELRARPAALGCRACPRAAGRPTALAPSPSERGRRLVELSRAPNGSKSSC